MLGIQAIRDGNEACVEPLVGGLVAADQENSRPTRIECIEDPERSTPTRVRALPRRASSYRRLLEHRHRASPTNPRTGPYIRYPSSSRIIGYTIYSVKHIYANLRM